MAGKESISWQRAHLVVRCACDILGLEDIPATPDLRLNMTVEEFGIELVRRYAGTHPGLVFRTESSIERARLERRFKEPLPKVHLRQGAPPRGSQSALADGHDAAADRALAEQPRQPAH